MPKTLFEKIWDAHLVATRIDGRELIYIDRHVLHELHAPHAFESLEKQGRPVRRPDLTFSMQDHTVSTRPGRTDTSNPDGAPFLRAMREGSRRNGIRVFDLGDPEQGISHVVAPELGMVLPGATHAVPDSHASTVGGLGALAFGCGTTELAHILATQVMALKRPKSMRIRLDGRLGAQVTAKDVALKIIAELGVAGGRGFVVEYAGTAVAAMPIEQRMTLCNLNIEMGGRSGFVAPDDATFAWLKGRPWTPQGAEWDTALAQWRTLKSDDDAKFDQEHALDCTSLEPQISWGTDPSQVVGISERVPDVANARQGRRAAMESALRLYGARARRAARRAPGQSRVHRLLHQCAPARPRGCRRGGARAACRRWRHRPGGAGLIDGEARGRSKGSRPRVPRCRLCMGRSPAARCARAAMATAASRASASSPPPTATSRTARARKCARISQAPRPRQLPPSPAASPMCANCLQGNP